MAHKHPVYDTDKHFVIDPITKKISTESPKMVVAQYSHDSERFTFEIPKEVEGHDMYVCNRVEIHYLNVEAANKTNKSDGVYEVDDLQTGKTEDGTQDIVFGSWLISGNATQYVGSLNFIVRFACVADDGTIDYNWPTLVYSGITIGESMCNSETIATEYADVLEQWVIKLEQTVATSLRKTLYEAKESGNFDGATFTPSVSENGDLSWNNDKGKQNPATVNIRGIQGETGKDGISPVISINTIDGGHRITITDANDTKTVEVMDGGVGPTGRGIKAVARTSGNGAAGTTDTYTITYTDDTTSTFSVYNGRDGIDGIDGTDGVSPVISVSAITGGHRITITDANGTKTVDAMDGATGRGIKAVARTSGNGAAGTTDTYTITYTDDTTSTFSVYNGRDGVDGIDGTDGVSVTHEWDGTTLKVTSASGTSEANLQGRQGEQGVPGVSVTHEWDGTTLKVTSASGTSSVDLRGPQGAGLTLLGSYESEEALNAAHPTGNIGDAYVIDGYLFAWSDTEKKWIGAGKIQGETGKPGVSPVISVDEIEGGHRITITDASGTKTVDVLNGSDGQDGQTGGVGPTGRGIKAVARTAGNGAAGTTDTYTITYTDDTTSTFAVYNGKDGVDGKPGGDGQDGYTPVKGVDYVDGNDGVSPTISVSTITGGHRITITDASGTKTVDVMNGSDGQDGQDGGVGPTGRGIKTIARTSGNGAAGTTDTYTITYTDNTTSTFAVYNGKDGATGGTGAPGANATINGVNTLTIAAGDGISASQSGNTLNLSVVGKAPEYTYSTTDLTAGTSALTTGKMHLVYE